MEPNNEGLTKEFVDSLFTYRDGALYWKVKFKNGVQIGQKAGCIAKRHSGDRCRIFYQKRNYVAARLIFLLHHGYLPRIVDHRDLNSLNDRIENLRDADYVTNGRNRTSAKGSTSKYLGVCKPTGRRKWISVINFEGRKIFLGSFFNEDDAALAYNEAAKKYFKEFAHLNIINP